MTHERIRLGISACLEGPGGRHAKVRPAGHCRRAAGGKVRASTRRAVEYQARPRRHHGLFRRRHRPLSVRRWVMSLRAAPTSRHRFRSPLRDPTIRPMRPHCLSCPVCIRRPGRGRVCPPLLRVAGRRPPGGAAHLRVGRPRVGDDAEGAASGPLGRAIRRLARSAAIHQSELVKPRGLGGRVCFRPAWNGDMSR